MEMRGGGAVEDTEGGDDDFEGVWPKATRMRLLRKIVSCGNTFRRELKGKNRESRRQRKERALSRTRGFVLEKCYPNTEAAANSGSKSGQQLLSHTVKKFKSLFPFGFVRARTDYGGDWSGQSSTTDARPDWGDKTQFSRRLPAGASCKSLIGRLYAETGHSFLRVHSVFGAKQVRHFAVSTAVGRSDQQSAMLSLPLNLFAFIFFAQ